MTRTLPMPAGFQGLARIPDTVPAVPGSRFPVPGFRFPGSRPPGSLDFMTTWRDPDIRISSISISWISGSQQDPCGGGRDRIPAGKGLGSRDPTVCHTTLQIPILNLQIYKFLGLRVQHSNIVFIIKDF